MIIHSTCKTKLEMERGESPRGYSWWRCPKCDRRVPINEVEMSEESK